MSFFDRTNSSATTNGTAQGGRGAPRGRGGGDNFRGGRGYRGGQAGGAYRGGQAAGGYRGGRGGAAGPPRDKAFIVTALQDEVLDMDKVQQHSSDVVDSLSNESYKRFIPMFLGEMIPLIGEEYERYRRLIVDMMLHARQLLFQPTLAALFVSVVEGNAFREVRTHPALEGLLKFAKSGDPDENAGRLSRAVSTALVELPQQQAPSHQRPQYNANESYENVGPVAGARDVVPTAEDLMEDVPPLTEEHGVVIGAGIDDAHCSAHLRVLHDLMRADCLHSAMRSAQLLRQIVMAMGDNNVDEWRLRKDLRKGEGGSRAIKVYTGITCTARSLHPSGVFYYIFSIPRKSRVRDRSFMTGNLVMWSAKFFSENDAVYVGVVVSVPGKHDDNYIFGVELLSHIGSNHHAAPAFGARWHMGTETFTFIESTAFFKPYRAAMKRLREMRDTIPLQPAILRGETATPPEYVLLSRRMNIGDFVALKEGSPKSFDVTLLGGGAAEGRDDLRYDVGAAEGVDDDDGNVRGWDSECLDWTHDLEDELRTHNKRCHVLDQTQRSALHHIFTHRVAIVQGTPGTGKTFLGTKFVQILLNNRDAVHSGPILCMAFTNHAVDAFLEDIVGMSGEQLRGENPIVRLGRGTRNEKFKQFEFNGGGPSRDMRDILDRMGQLTARFRNSQGLLESRTAAFAHIRETLLVGIAKDMRVDVNDDVMGALEELDACTILKGIPRRDSQKLWTGVAMATLKEELKLLRIRANAGENTKPETEYYEMIRDTITYLMEGRFRDTDYMRRLWEYYEINQYISLNMIFDWWLSLPEVVDIRGIQIHPKRHLMSTARQLRSRTKLPAEIKQFLLASYQSTNSEAEAAPEEHDEAIAALAAEERQRRFNAEAHYNGDNDVLHIDTSRFSSKEDYAKMEAFINNHTPQHSTHANDNNRVEHLLSLSLEDRRLLHQAVMAVAKYRTAEEISSILESPATAVTIENSRAEIQRRDARVLRNAKVIVGTTDSVMTHLSALQNAGIRVMVVEEAAEVLESHVLASMTENLEHLVLIGDHKQLRPKANEMELELKKGLCVSLQERLILCGAPFETLTMQRRMHPVISRIVHPYYARDEQPGDQPVVITDHPRTELIEEPLCVGVGDRCYRTYMVGYEKEKGVREEQLDPKIESPGNRYECDVVSGIVRHLLRYHRDKSITVLVPYTGQLLWIKEKLKDLQQTILCRTVDDFQGEESDFVVLSLTRTERAGFLVHENRACVALSRARMGCYLVGCTDVVRRASPLLGHFVSLMEQDGTLGDSFPARCPTHKHEFAFRSLKDYDQLICRDKCAYIMECHHACERICHEGDHAKCQKPCERVGPLCKSVQARSCKHPCKKKCHEHCGPCHVRVPYTCADCGASFEVACYELDDTSKIKCRNPIVLLTTADSPCGHEVSGMCWQRREVAVDADKFVQKHCKQKCEQHMPCGHLCPRKCHCGEDDLHHDQTKRCHALCTAKHPICGHMVERKCSSDPKDAHSYSRCEQVCGKVSAIHGCACRLKCGHTGSCDCGTEHVKKCERCQDSKNVKCGDYSSFVCPSPCTYKLLCGHVCPGHCGECAGSSSRGTDEPTFMSHQRCANKCKHIHPCGHACQDGCDVKCGPCMLPCDFSCGHGQPHRGHACSECPARHCQEPCQWSCKHHTCTLRCHEPCTRPVCDEQCDKELPCGHRCFGLCGERCPRFCPQCYRDGKEEMKAIRDMITMDDLPDDEAEAYARGVLPSLMEDEKEVDYRMVEMPCCGVLTTVGFLDRYLLSFAKPDAENGDNGSVACKVPRCPWCMDTVMPNYYNRGRAVVCASHQLLMNVNKHIKKTDDKNRKTCQEAMLHLLKATEHKSVDDAQDVLTAWWNRDKLTSSKNPKKKREAAKQLSQKVSNAMTLMKVDLTCPKISYPCYETMIDWLFGEEASDRRDSSIYVVNSIIHLWQWHDTLDMSDKRPTWGADSIKAYCLYMLRNHMASSLAESLALTVEWLCMMSSAHHLQLTSRMLDTLCEANARFFPANNIPLPEKCFLSDSVMRQMRDELKQAWPLVHAELASHRDRLKLFTKALGVTAGHWYECANGHVYVIGDCGGAMERATCPECGGAIGGEQHAVDRTNRSAAHRVERGARPAWPQGHML